MTTRNVIGLGLFLIAAVALHGLLPALWCGMHGQPSQPPIVSGILEQGKAPAGYAFKFSKGDRVRVCERFYMVEHGDELTIIPSEKFEDVVLRRE